MKKYYEEAKYNAAFDRCVDVMSQMLQKYGHQGYNMYATCIFAFLEKRRMDCKNRIIKLRESTGLNRKDFCKLVHIPYRTMTEWELDNRHAPDYVLRLLEYYIRNEGLMVKEMSEGGSDSEKEAT